MDILPYELFKEIMKAQTHNELIELTKKVNDLNNDQKLESEIDLILLQLALLTKDNSISINNALEEIDGVSIIFEADPSFFEEIEPRSSCLSNVLSCSVDNLDHEEIQLKLMKEEDLNDLKLDKVYNVKSLKKED